MPKVLKIVLIGIAALLALLLAAAGIIAATFDPNDYKPLVIRMVQEKKQRTLTIPGDIKLSFFPKIGADLGKLSISERNSSAEFAAVERANVSLALIPLLARQLVVDRVQIDGLRVNIRRDKDGRTNADDLLGGEKSSSSNGQQIAFDIDSVDIDHAHIVYDDRQQARRFEIAGLKLETGKIANRVPGKLALSADIKGNKPAIDAHVAVKSGFTLDLDEQHYVVKGLDAELKGALAGITDMLITAAGDADIRPETRRFALEGVKVSAKGKLAREAMEARLDIPKLAITDKQVSGGKLSGDARLSHGARSVTANFSAPSFEGSPQAFRLPAMTLESAIREDKLDARVKISGALAGDIDRLLFTSPQLALTLSGKQGDTALNGALTTPLAINLKTQLIDLPKLVADFSLPHPGGGILALKAGGSASVNLGKSSASANLNGSLDQSAFSARLGLSDFSPLTYVFDIGIDRLDLDRYKARPQPRAATASAPAAEQPMDFSALQKLRANGRMRVGEMKVANMHATNVRLDLRAADGKLDISPLAANLYGGSTTGALSVTAASRLALRQNLSGIHVGPLLKDATGKDSLEGRGNVQLDVASGGGTVARIKKGLNGSARLELRDGAIRGVNIAQAVRSARAKIDALRGNNEASPHAGTGSTAEKTDFSELSASFRITGGVAHNEDLTIKSPLIRVTGSGEVDLGQDRLDYLARTTVVSTLQGQGGPELQALKGLTVPVRLSGPFDAIGWKVDVAGMASELAKQKLDERKDELKSKARKSLDEEKTKLQDQLKDQLKGLLGR